MTTIDYEDQNTRAIIHLTKLDPDLQAIYKKTGLPRFWSREQGFTGLLQIILEQQVSLSSGKAVYDKLSQIIPDISPEKFLKIDDSNLRRAGFSKQKIKYSRILAEEVLCENLDFEQIAFLSDEQAKKKLMRIKGIGGWTADCYLIFCLNRPDIWPAGDLALNKALKVVKNLENVPDQKNSNKIAIIWKPWRSVAARMLWHYYLSNSFPKFSK